LHRAASTSSLHQPVPDIDGAPFSPSEYESDADWEDVSSPVLPPSHDHASDIIDLDEYYSDARLAHGADGDRQLYASVGMTLGNNQTMLSVIEEGEEEEEDDDGLGAGERRLPPVYRY
jgi:hypothetical protein